MTDDAVFNHTENCAKSFSNCLLFARPCRHQEFLPNEFAHLQDVCVLLPNCQLPSEYIFYVYLTDTPRTTHCMCRYEDVRQETGSLRQSLKPSFDEQKYRVILPVLCRTEVHIFNANFGTLLLAYAYQFQISCFLDI